MILYLAIMIATMAILFWVAMLYMGLKFTGGVKFQGGVKVVGISPPAPAGFTEDWEDSGWQTDWDGFYDPHNGNDDSAYWGRSSSNPHGGTYSGLYTHRSASSIALKDLGAEISTAVVWCRFRANTGESYGLVFGGKWDGDNDFTGGGGARFEGVGSTDAKVGVGYFNASGDFTYNDTSSDFTPTTETYYKLTVTWVKVSTTTTVTATVKNAADATLGTSVYAFTDNSGWETNFVLRAYAGASYDIEYDDMGVTLA